MHQNKSPVYKVAENCHKLTVHRILKPFPGKFTVFCFGSNSCKVIPQSIYHLPAAVIFFYKVIYIIFHLYAPSAAGAHLISFQIHELVARYIFRQNISMQLQHHRENNSMKYNIVFAYKMYKLCFRIIPVRFPIFIIIYCPLFGGAYVSDGRIKPNI